MYYQWVIIIVITYSKLVILSLYAQQGLMQFGRIVLYVMVILCLPVVYTECTR